MKRITQFCFTTVVLFSGCVPNSNEPINENSYCWGLTTRASYMLHTNAYQEYESFDRYHGYGMVYFSRDSERDGKRTDEDFLVESITKCRGNYGVAYRDQQMTRHDGDTQKFMTFKPTYIAFLLNDRKDDYDVGVVIPSEKVFSEIAPIDLIRSSHIYRGNLYYEDVEEEEKQRGYSPGKVIHYAHVDQHMDELGTEDQ